MTTLRPADFGPLGSPSDDTTAMTALAAVAQSGDVVELSGQLQIDGEILFSGHQRLSVVGRALVQQIDTFKKTLRFEQFGHVDVEGVDFQGLGGTSGEYDGASSNYNQVSALYFDTGEYASVDKISCKDHAGGDVNFRNVKQTKVHNSRFQGIGSAYINPIDNGSDFAISAQSWTHLPMSLDYCHDWSHNTIRGHAFGTQAVGTKSMILQSNEISCEGQHGFYGIENDGLNVVGNNFYGCPQQAIKMQHENYGGQFFGQTAWAASTFMNTGVERLYNGTLYLCISGHTSSSSFMNDWLVDIRWKVSPKMIRRGGVISGNEAYDCGSVVGIISSSLSNAKEEYIDGLTITDNGGYNCLSDGFTLDRCVNLNMHNNRVEKAGRYGVLFRDSSGSVTDNRINKSAWAGMFGSFAFDMNIKGNKLLDTGLTGAGIADKFPIYIGATVPATAIPSQASNPTIVFDANDIRYTSGDCASAQATFFDVRYKVDMTENRTNSLKPGRINGTKLRTRNNDFTSII